MTLRGKIELFCRDGLPIIPKNELILLRNSFDDDEILQTIASVIFDNKPDYPRKISIQNSFKADDMFFKLLAKDVKEYLKPKGQEGREVLEKFSDYRRPYSSHGLGIIDSPAHFNIISDYDMYEERMKCGSTFGPSPHETWTKHPEKMAKLFKYFYRSLSDGSVDVSTYIASFRIGSYLATQFKPPVAKCIYSMTNATKVLDTSCGWGDRLTGFYTTPNAKEYVGCDPNGNVWIKYIDMVRRYEKLLGSEPVIDIQDDVFRSVGHKTVTIYRSGAENIPWDEIDNVDVAFTSPPYYATERYGEGGDDEQDQSWKKHDSYESWRDNFYLPVAHNSFDSLSEGGYLMTNILDPVVKGKRYRAGDDLIDTLEDHFIGQLGMRYSQRPKVTETKEDLTEFMQKCYIENVWCFRKGEERQPLFDTGLDAFWA